MCDNSIETYPSTIQYVPDQCKTQKMSDKAVNGCFILFHSVPDRYMTQEICHKVFSEVFSCLNIVKIDLRLIKCTVDDFPPSLKFAPDWFVTCKVIKNFTQFYMQMIIYLFMTKVIAISHFIVIKWVILA